MRQIQLTEELEEKHNNSSTNHSKDHVKKRPNGWKQRRAFNSLLIKYK